MEGLASIALAVDLLEQREKAQAKKDGAANYASAVKTPPSQTPKRIVSSDSVTHDMSNPGAKETMAPTVSQAVIIREHQFRQPSAIMANAPRGIQMTPPMVSPDMAPEMISEMVANLAKDEEFDGRPPPKPPTPTEEVTAINDCDVLCGRGGETNHHHGNVQYRLLVKKYQPLYIASKRRDKPLIASKIVRIVRHSGGRFLRKDTSNIWRDVGNNKAREKTSQALREGAPELRGSPSKDSTLSETSISSMGHYGMHQVAPPVAQPTHLGLSRLLGAIRQPMYAVGPGGMAPRYVVSSNGMRPGEGHAANAHPAKRMKMETSPEQPSTVTQPADNTSMQGRSQPTMAVSTQSHATTEPARPPAATPAVAPQPCTATVVSADDEDSRSDGDGSVDSSKPRGPRLKLLKKRLQEQHN